MPEYHSQGPITVAFTLGGGAVDITTAESAPESTAEQTNVTVEVTPYDGSEASQAAAAKTTVEFHGDTLYVSAPDVSGSWLWRRSGRIRVTARVPVDSTLALRLASADATCRGRYATGQLGTASGNVTIEQVTGDLLCHTASGDVTIDRVGGDLNLRTASGDGKVGMVGGDVAARTASGDLAFGAVAGSMRVGSASGGVRVGELRRGAVQVKSSSGDIALGVRAGTAVWLDLTTVSGQVRNELAMTQPPATPGRTGAADLELQVRTASGDIVVRRIAVASSEDQLSTA